MERSDEVLTGNALDVLRELPAQSVNCCVTSPPYWGLRDYGVDGQLGLEKTPEEYVNKLVEIFREVKRVLRDDGTLWLNLGDSYAGRGRTASSVKYSGYNVSRAYSNGAMPQIVPPGLKPKDLVGIPWRVAFALQSDGWYLRSDIIWAKRNCLPESVRDRPTKSHEHVFLLAKSKRYYYDQDAIREPAINGERFHGGYNKVGIVKNTAARNGRNDIDNRTQYRNKRDVWFISTKPFKGAHFAVFPPDLVRPCILAGCPEGGIVLDPFFGSGTVGVVAKQEKRHYIGIELNPEYVKMAEARIAKECPMEVLV